MNILQYFDLYNTFGEVGIEIEMEGHALPHHFRKWWRADHDGSLRGESVEWVLTSPISREEVPKALDYLIFQCNRGDRDAAMLVPSDRCGVHVHINCQTMPIRDTFVFAFLYLLLEPLLMRWCGDNREGNMFCLRSSDADGIIWYMQRAIELGSLSGFRTNDLRYASLNLLALTQYGSLEFRGMGAPKNLMKICKWVEMLLSLKDAAKDFQAMPDVLEQVSGKLPEDFLRLIFNEKQIASLSVPNMGDILFDSARRIQDIAFAKRGFRDAVWFDDKDIPGKNKKELHIPEYHAKFILNPEKQKLKKRRRNILD